VLPHAYGKAREPLACGAFPMLPEISGSFGTTGFMVLSNCIWYLPNLVFGRNVKNRPNWEATITLADSREINSPRGLDYIIN
jgi:hypothetical protein